MPLASMKAFFRKQKSYPKNNKKEDEKENDDDGNLFNSEME